MVCFLDPCKRQLGCLGVCLSSSTLSLAENFCLLWLGFPHLSFFNLPLLQFHSSLPWTWEQCLPLNCWWPPTRLHVATVPKTTIQNFLARRPPSFYFNCVSQGCSHWLTCKELDFSCKLLHIFSSVIDSAFFWDMPLCHWEIGAQHFETTVFIKMLGTGHPVMQHHILEA